MTISYILLEYRDVLEHLGLLDIYEPPVTHSFFLQGQKCMVVGEVERKYKCAFEFLCWGI